MASERGPSLIYGHRNTAEVPLFWFTRVEKDQRLDFEKRLGVIVDQIVTKDTSLPRKTFESIPWIRNYDPTLKDLQAFVWSLGEGSGACVLAVFDGYQETQTLHVIHPNKDGFNSCLSTGFNEAVTLLLKVEPWKPLSDEALAGIDYSPVDLGPRPSLPVLDDMHDDRRIASTHIAPDVVLTEDIVTLFSLVKLTDDEIKRIRQGINADRGEVVIHNWPYEIPASDADVHNMFHQVKPPTITPCEETFVFFIDVEYIEGPMREPVVFYIKEQTPSSPFIKQHPTDYAYLQLVTGDFGGLDCVKEKWKAIWHPPRQPYHVADVCVNPAFDHIRQRQHPRADWSYPHTVISAPSIPVFGGRGDCEFVAFVLCPITPLELRALKAMIKIEGRGGQYVQLSLENDSMESLLTFFDSPTFRKYSKPPSYFAAIDKKSLQSLMRRWPKYLQSTWDETPFPIGDEDEEEPTYMLFANALDFWHNSKKGEMIAQESPGYQFVRLDLRDTQNLSSVIANLSTGNMWFDELEFAFVEGDEIDWALWPEYKGLTKNESQFQWS